MKKIMYSFILILSLLASCGNREAGFFANKSEEVVSDMMVAPASVDETVKFVPPTINSESDVSGGERMEEPRLETKVPTKIRKTAYLNVSVDDYKKARTEIEQIIKLGNGYIGNENEQNTTYSITNEMMIRVVNKDFDAMVAKLLTVATNVNSKSVTAEDVTAEFVDIQLRLKSKKEIEKRYLDILQKASKVTDILEIEQKLGEIREEIEAKEGELKLLANQVDYSTIHFSFQQAFEYTPTDKPGFWGRVGGAFGNGWNGFLSFVIGLIYAWPLWIILGLSIYFIIRFIKRRLKKK
jgi:Domain of unknown function (DUF4349)